MMISEKDYNRFLMLRKRLFKQIEKQLKEEEHCKSYEGLFTISIEFNDYFEQEDNKSEINCWTISLDLHLIVPNGRHHLWTGKTFKEALDACEKDINTWINFHNKYLKGKDVDFDSIELKLAKIDESKLREIGFTDYDEPYWYYCERLYGDITFNLTIPKNNPNKWYIDVLDELFLQPYPFKSIKTEYAKRVEKRYNEVIEKLKSLGIFVQ